MFARIDANDKRFEKFFQGDCVLFVNFMLEEFVTEQVFMNLVSQVKEILEGYFTFFIEDLMGETPVGF